MRSTTALALEPDGACCIGLFVALSAGAGENPLIGRGLPFDTSLFGADDRLHLFKCLLLHNGREGVLPKVAAIF